MTVQEYLFTGRIGGLRIWNLPEFGTRASFTIEGPGQHPVVCALEGDVAREFVTRCHEGDIVTVIGFDEARPSTAAAETPWHGRFHVRALRVAEEARLAA